MISTLDQFKIEKWLYGAIYLSVFFVLVFGMASQSKAQTPTPTATPTAEPFTPTPAPSVTPTPAATPTPAPSASPSIDWTVMKNYMEMQLWSIWFAIGVILCLVVAITFDIHRK